MTTPAPASPRVDLDALERDPHGDNVTKADILALVAVARAALRCDDALQNVVVHAPTELLAWEGTYKTLLARYAIVSALLAPFREAKP